MRLYVQTDSRLQQREGEIFDDNFPGLVILEWEFAFMKIKPKRRIDRRLVSRFYDLLLSHVSNLVFNRLCIWKLSL
eukprot:UN0208